MIYILIMEQKIILDLLSDTHNQHGKFKTGGGDILLHTGDFTLRGSDQEVQNFMLWMGQQNYKHKVAIPGNHDFSIESNYLYWKDEFEKRGIHLLNDSGVQLEGINIWGSPITPWFHSWAFNRARTEAEATARHRWIKPHWDAIPDNTEILLTHGPPMGILDEVTRPNGTPYDPPNKVGCEELLKRIEELNVSLHLFGHIHEGRGFQYCPKITFVNGSSLDRTYSPADDKPMRIIKEICQDGSIAYIL